MDLVHGLYSITSIAMVLFYIPQMIEVTKSQDGAKGISLISWAFWSVGTVSATLYAFYVLNDFKVIFVSAASSLCCIYIALVTYIKRKRLRIQTDPQEPSPELPRFKKAG